MANGELLMARIILHVDLNSFFARASQQANPALQGKPVGIVKARGRTCIIAASVEAKSYGVATGCRVNDAKKLCPQIILLPADFDKYEDISRRFIKICASYSPLCEVFSLDECFIDVSETTRFWHNRPITSREHLAWIELVRSLGLPIGAINIAFDIKRRLNQEIGDFMTCSVGISYNRLLAKLASNQIKPDGLFWITSDNALNILDKSHLMGICGLGFGLYNHLIKLEIDNFSKLRACSPAFLHKHFGPYWAVHLFNICRGIDNTAVIPYQEIPEAKSVGRTYTTHKPLNDKNAIYKLTRNLVEEVSAKARKMGLTGRYVGFSMRSGEEYQNNKNNGWLANRSFSKGWHGHRTLKNYIDDGKKLFDVCRLISKDWEFKNIIFCSVTLGMLAKKAYSPLVLFPDDKKQENLIQTIDKINWKLGDYTIFPSQLLGTSIIRPEVTGYFGDKKFRLNFLRK